MTNEETINGLTLEQAFEVLNDMYKSEINYNKACALSYALDYIELRMIKKPRIVFDGYAVCPNCGMPLSSIHRFCDGCGQFLLWETI